MVAKLLLIVGICALLYVGCQALNPGSGLIAAVPPADPTEAAVWSTDQANAASVRAETQDARQAAKRQSDQDAQATLDERARRANADQQSAAATAETHREQSTQAAQERADKEQRQIRAITQAAQSTADERAWIAQGWTATADSGQSATQAVRAQQVADRQSTADAAGVQALSTAQYAQAFVISQKATQEALRTAREATVNNALAWTPYVAWPLVGILLCVGFWYWRRHQVVQRDANGMLPGVRVGDKVLDPERSVIPVLDPNIPIQAPLDAHLQITSGAQKVQALRQIRDSKVSPSQALNLMKPAPEAAPAVVAAHQPHPPAPWSTFVGISNGPIPLGVGPNGQAQIPDLEEWPHRLFAGKTGAGKSRYGLRPFAAGALGRGWSVVVIGDRAPVDFKVFDGRPNYYPLTLDDPADILPYLLAINQEINARWKLLYKAGASTWSRLGGADPRVAIIFDEFAALYDDLDGTARTEFVRLVANISRTARKAGVHLVAGVQNPTVENIRGSIKRNMLSVAFQVTDPVASRVIIDTDGAEKIQPPEYLARMTSVLWHGVGFDPSDEQIADYLDRRNAPIYNPPSFLIEPVKLDAPDDRPRLPSAEIQNLAQQIRPGWELHESKRDLARRVGKEYAGAFCAKIDAAIAFLTATTATTTPPGAPGGTLGTFVNSSSSTFGD